MYGYVLVLYCRSAYYDRSARGTSASTARAIAKPTVPTAGSSAAGGPTCGSRAAAAASSAAKARRCAAASVYVESKPGMAGQPLPSRPVGRGWPPTDPRSCPGSILAEPWRLLLSSQVSSSTASSSSWSPRARRGAVDSPSAAVTPQSRSPPRVTGETGATTWPTQRWERWCPTAIPA